MRVFTSQGYRLAYEQHHECKFEDVNDAAGLLKQYLRSVSEVMSRQFAPVLVVALSCDSCSCPSRWYPLHSTRMFLRSRKLRVPKTQTEVLLCEPSSAECRAKIFVRPLSFSFGRILGMTWFAFDHRSYAGVSVLFPARLEQE